MKQIHAVVGMVLAILGAVGSQSVLAGPKTDEMVACFGKSAAAEERALLVKWMYASAGLHAQAKSSQGPSADELTALNRKVANVYNRLATDACKAETAEALKADGRDAFAAGFRALSDMAARDLFGDAGVQTGLGEFTKYLDRKSLSGALGTDPWTAAQMQNLQLQEMQNRRDGMNNPHGSAGGAGGGGGGGGGRK